MIPILYICYNRIDYVKQTLPLLLNKGKVYICSEGYNNDSNELVKRGVIDVRSYLHQLNIESDQKFIIWERDKNYGLEQNVLDSFKWICSLEEEFIVCEEDIILNDNFFDFINNNKNKIGLNKNHQFISRCLYNHIKEQGNYFFNAHGWYTKSECLLHFLNKIENYSKLEFLDIICKYIYKPSKDSYKAVMGTLLKRNFFWDEALKYSIFFNKGSILYAPDNSTNHIGKISSNQHGFIWLEDGTYKRII